MNTPDNLRQAESGVYYTPDFFDDWISAVGDASATRAGRKGKVINLPCAFDIETTSAKTSGGQPYGTMYAWAFALDGAVMIGRTWEQWQLFMTRLQAALNISSSRRLWIFVHNNQFDFQFYRHYLNVVEVFAREARRPMFVRDDRGFEFRDSFILTNSSLANVGKNLVRLPVQKLTSDLDYSLPRHFKTPLTDKEIQYIINDVLVVTSLIFERMGGETGGLSRIPLTQTGYSRKHCKSACLPYDDSESRWKYVHKMEKLQLTKAEYVMAKEAFLGGFTHASPQHVTDIVEDVVSMDFTSSYPAVIVSEQVPMGPGIEVDASTIQSREELLEICDEFACLMYLELTDIDSKTETDYYISESRVEYDEDTTESFNGRIASSDKITLCCTDIDLDIILRMYDVGGITVLRMFKYYRDYLPTPYVRTVLELYKAKTELKQVEGKEEEYQRAKEMVNSLYGMMAMKIDSPEVLYDQEWLPSELPDLDEVLDKYNSDKYRFTSYLWGCWVTAAARRNVISGVLNCGEDYLYSDTDSVKLTNYEKHKPYFERYNKWITSRIKAACQYHNIPYEMAAPRTQKGKRKPLGVWDFDGHYPLFKTLGAKRYMYTTDDGQLHITCAGVSKVYGVQYLLDTYKTPEAAFKAFDNNLNIPGRYIRPDGTEATGTGKMTHIYNDAEVTEQLTDYLGNTATVHEMSSIYLEPADYSLGISGEFYHFLELIRDNRYIL